MERSTRQNGNTFHYVSLFFCVLIFIVFYAIYSIHVCVCVCVRVYSIECVHKSYILLNCVTLRQSFSLPIFHSLSLSFVFTFHLCIHCCVSIMSHFIPSNQIGANHLIVKWKLQKLTILKDKHRSVSYNYDGKYSKPFGRDQSWLKIWRLKIWLHLIHIISAQGERVRNRDTFSQYDTRYGLVIILQVSSKLIQ